MGKGASDPTLHTIDGAWGVIGIGLLVESRRWLWHLVLGPLSLGWMFRRLRWDQSRVALSGWVCHDGPKEIAGTMPDGGRLGSCVSWKTVDSQVGGRTTSSFQLLT